VNEPPLATQVYLFTSSTDANCSFYKVDITSSEEIHAAAKDTRGELGELTVLVNNAGFGSATPLLQVPEDVVRKVFDVNIISHFLLVKEFLPVMVDRNHGHIVTVASMASFMTQASNVDYACTKAAALALHEGLNQELKILYNAPLVRTS
jgi:short-subunit dehydrogenase